MNTSNTKGKGDLHVIACQMITTCLPGTGWVQSGSQFRRNNGEAVNVFYAHLADMVSELWLNIAVGLVFPRVEKVFVDLNIDNSGSHEWTVEGIIASYLPKAKLRFRLLSNVDVESTKAKISEIVSSACIPIWDKLGTIAKLDQEWNSRTYDFGVDGTNAFHHAMRSVIVAKLVFNPNFDPICELRRREIQSLLDHRLQHGAISRFDQLVISLKLTDANQI